MPMEGGLFSIQVQEISLKSAKNMLFSMLMGELCPSSRYATASNLCCTITTWKFLYFFHFIFEEILLEVGLLKK